MTDKELKFKSKDNQEFKFPLEYAIKSDTINSMIFYDKETDTIDNFDISGIKNDSIPLDITFNISELIKEYLEHTLTEKNNNEKVKWENEYLEKMNDDLLFELILAANYLDIKCLLDVTCKKVADYIKQCKTPQEIRRRFNIKNDFTPEEEEEIKKENSWCEY